MNTIIEDDDRFDEIESVCAMLNIEKCETYLRKMPLEAEDPDGSMFNKFTKLIQAISMWPTTIGPEKCTIAQAVVEYNQAYNLPVSNISGYYNSACLEY